MAPAVDLGQPTPDDALLARPDVTRLLDARLHDPFAVLGVHAGMRWLWRPGARAVQVEGREARRVGASDLFALPASALAPHPAVCWQDLQDGTHHDVDPWGFGPQIGDLDLHLFGEGRHWHVYRVLGAHPCTVDGIAGTRFATWAPNAERVSVVGDFNDWDGRCHPLRVRGASGVWELFLPGVGEGALYKFEIRSRADGSLHLKTDPYGQRFELRPATAAVVSAGTGYAWQDAAWIERRRRWDWQHAPVSIYEVHLGSWQRAPDGSFLGYRELAERLVPHVIALGFTHIELLPVTEHPLDDSWGYQATGYFAPTSRHGTPEDFRFFVDHCHRHGIGVLLDWVPAHFPRDAHALARFDGMPLYEHADPRRGEHRDWGTLIYDYGRHEVRNFLLASANFWLEECHVDGLRVDAVASMLYLDYSREPADWIPNEHGGRENLEAVRFLRELNVLTHGLHPGTLTLAEESTAWPQVSRPVESGGLGFSMKWNMGWMHDSLHYFARDPVHRRHHHNDLSFGLLYAFSENFLLPLSHDEVVHGKRSLRARMPGDAWQQLANLRLLLAWQFTSPGAKLLFMGVELADPDEWWHARGLDWSRAQGAEGGGMHALLRDLNALYRELPALHARGFEPQGFEWLDCHDAAQSVLSFVRKGMPCSSVSGPTEAHARPAPDLSRENEKCCVVVLNFTPVVRRNYRVALPCGGHWREALNSDSRFYGGSDVGNGGTLVAQERAHLGRAHSLALTLPPLAALLLVPD